MQERNESGAYGASLTIHRYLKCDQKVKMLQFRIYSVTCTPFGHIATAREIYYHKECF